MATPHANQGADELQSWSVWGLIPITISPQSAFTQIVTLVSKAIHLNCPWDVITHPSPLSSQTSIKKLRIITLRAISFLSRWIHLTYLREPFLSCKTLAKSSHKCSCYFWTLQLEGHRRLPFLRSGRFDHGKVLWRTVMFVLTLLWSSCTRTGKYEKRWCEKNSNSLHQAIKLLKLLER